MCIETCGILLQVTTETIKKDLVTDDDIVASKVEPVAPVVPVVEEEELDQAGEIEKEGEDIKARRRTRRET